MRLHRVTFQGQRYLFLVDIPYLQETEWFNERAGVLYETLDDVLLDQGEANRGTSFAGVASGPNGSVEPGVYVHGDRIGSYDEIVFIEELPLPEELKE